MTTVVIKVDGQQITATLEENAAARDFLALLPLTLTLEDYHRTEKISDLPAPLSTDGVPAGIDPEVGDITYYAPWGNLAIFYRDFGYAKGLVKLGHIDSGLALLTGKSPFQVTIERVE
ncbi:cyclophilin-like fold protein [Halioxenophilus sp. WMMB6]|uniref:cyclophilin-like fold protein n=1 Tax=Halioxenophilus sp. WMMB6 TaxID=3073815 RepID=UPI00295F0C67|nr:cyclophilin-like fold protein [Halioxenophilus sp. WMMB6]